jgi:polyhydroxyalkanoate synthesis regulator phasin
VAKKPQPRQRGISESLRSAIERTFAATAGPAAESRERAGELLDEVVRRGQEARDAVEDVVVRRLEEQVGTLSKRLEELEKALGRRRRR